MSRICIIGDSHVAALRQAMKADPAIAGGHEITFFASIGATMRDVLGQTNGVVTTTDPKVAKSFRMTAGREDIVLSDYDAICLVGFGTGLGNAVRMACRYAPLAMGIDGADPVSQPLFSSILTHAYRRSLATEIAGLVTGHGGPVGLVANPNMSEAILDHETGAPCRKVIAAGAGAALVSAYKAAMQSAFAERLSVIDQPGETVVSDFLTDRRYSENSVRLSRKEVAHPDDDFDHMNADFGAKIIRAILDRLVTG